MKIDKVIFGVDDSYFLEFWPIQAKICKEVLGIQPVLFYISEEDSNFYHDGHGLVKKVKKVGNKHTGMLACIVRLWATKFFPDDVCITGDLDMLMINREYFINQIEKYNDDSLVIYSSDAYDLNRPEAQQLFKTEPFPFVQEMYNYPYFAAKGKTYDKIMDFNCSFEEFVLRHETYKPGYKFMWMIDEFYFADCVNNKEHGVEVHKLRRGYTSPWIANRRIDRGNFPVQLKWPGEIEHQKKYGFYDEQKLRDGYYIDVNCCRPYSDFKDAIDYVVQIVMENKNLEHIEIENTTELCEIMKDCGSDKSCKPDWVNYEGHNYTRYYHRLFEKNRYDSLKIFELGIGTNNPNLPSNMGKFGKPGASLRGWKKYFPNAKIYGADVDKNILFSEDRIETFFCDQRNSQVIKEMWGKINEEFDIIIDDGLHEFNANLNFLLNSLDKLKVNGIYIIEDVVFSEIELWKKQIETLEKIYSNYDFKIIKLEWTHKDNNLVVIKKKKMENKKNKRIEELLQTPRMFYADATPRYNQLKGLKMLIDDFITENDTVVEIGSFAGVSSELFALHCKEIYCVDLWDPYWEIKDKQRIEFAEMAFDKLTKEYKNIHKFKMSSVQASQKFKDSSLDFVYIDAAHDYQSVKEDILTWFPKVKKGGYIAGHDYRYDVNIGVYEAVNDIFVNDYKIISYPDSSFVIQK